MNLPDESTTSTSSRLETLNVFVRNGAIFASKYCLELYFGGPIRLQYPQNPSHIVRQQTCAARNCTYQVRRQNNRLHYTLPNNNINEPVTVTRHLSFEQINIYIHMAAKIHLHRKQEFAEREKFQLMHSVTLL